MSAIPEVHAAPVAEPTPAGSIARELLLSVAWPAAGGRIVVGGGQPPLDPAFGATVLAVALIMAANTVLWPSSRCRWHGIPSAGAYACWRTAFVTVLPGPLALLFR